MSKIGVFLCLGMLMGMINTPTLVIADTYELTYSPGYSGFGIFNNFHTMESRHEHIEYIQNVHLLGTIILYFTISDLNFQGNNAMDSSSVNLNVIVNWSGIILQDSLNDLQTGQEYSVAYDLSETDLFQNTEHNESV